MRRRPAGLAVLAVAALAAGCARTDVAPDVVARIGRDPVRYAEFEAFLRGNGGADAPRNPEVLSRLLDQYLDERLLQRTALDRGLVRPGAGARAALDALLRADPRLEPATADVRSYFESHREQFSRPERVHLRQIVTATREDGQSALAELSAGEAFGDVARRHSRGPLASRGGDQGWLERGDLPPSFADLIFAIPDGGHSGIQEAEYGWLIFGVDEHRPAVEPSFEEAESDARAALRREVSDRLVGELVSQARSRYTTEVYAKNLPFRYRGPHAPGE